MPQVKVPQTDGEIVITTADGSITYKVSDHTTSVKAQDMSRFLSTIDGSEPIVAKPAANKEQ